MNEPMESDEPTTVFVTAYELIKSPALCEILVHQIENEAISDLIFSDITWLLAHSQSILDPEVFFGDHVGSVVEAIAEHAPEQLEESINNWDMFRLSFFRAGFMPQNRDQFFDSENFPNLELLLENHPLSKELDAAIEEAGENECVTASDI